MDTKKHAIGSYIIRNLAQTSTSPNVVLLNKDLPDKELLSFHHSKSSRSTGPASQASNGRQIDSAAMAANGRLSEILTCQAANPMPTTERIQPDLVKIEYTSKLIGLLRPFSIFEVLVDHQLLRNQVFSIASSLVLGALPHVKSFIERENMSDNALAQKITENTLHPLVVPSSMTASEFHTLFTGQNLRWEFVGFLFACAGRSALVEPSKDGTFLDCSLEIVDRAAFVHQLMMASRTCVALCRQNGAVVNDILIWLLYENT